MIGGVVVDTLVLEDKAWINRQERYFYNLGKKPNEYNTCGVYVEKTDKARCVSEKDIVWWQGDYAYWTPRQNRINEEESKKLEHKAGIHYEIKLKRIGFSGVKKPKTNKREYILAVDPSF